MLFGAMNNPLKPLLPEIDRVAGLGFDYLELAMDAPHGHYAKIEKDIDTIIESLARHRLSVVCHLPTFVYTADLTESIRSASQMEMRRSIAVAARLKAMKVVVHPSIISGLATMEPELVSAYARRALKDIVEECEDRELTPCLENMFPRYRAFVSADQFNAVFKEFPTLQLTLDTGHANIKCKGKNRSFAFLARHAERLGHLHISDNHGEHDDHLAVGDGNIDFKAVVGALKRAGYDGTVTLEIFSPNPMDIIRSRSAIERLWSLC